MKSEWISIKDRLPEEYVKVLTYAGPNCEMKVDHIVIGYEPIWACRYEAERSKVTHWVPLPKPPKG